jgi:hypothetical protein
VSSRELFISEHRYISNILREFAGIDLQASDPVVSEYYAPPRTKSRVRFNNDYFLEFAAEKDQSKTATKAYGSVILPNTLGVQVFLVVDENTSKPLMTELLGGEAFPIKYFKEYVDKIEDRLAELSCPMDLHQTLYCRIFVVGCDICFLAFPNDTSPIVRGKRELLYADEESSVAFSVDRAEVVYVDGWIRTEIAERDQKIEAISIQ